MQPVSIAPAVVMNQGGARQQVPLRDYLNARIAPFLKKAMTQSLEVEAEYPLQWLGECLIHQSILYEGNPDETNIRERFKYTFKEPTPAAAAETNGEPAAGDTAMQTTDTPAAQAMTDSMPMDQNPQIPVNPPTEPQEVPPPPQPSESTQPEADTVMGDTS